MNVVKIILVCLLVILIYVVYKLASSSDGTTLVDMHDAKVSKTIVGSEVPSSVSSQDTGYSFWAVVDDWGYNYGTGIERIIFHVVNHLVEFQRSQIYYLVEFLQKPLKQITT